MLQLQRLLRDLWCTREGMSGMWKPQYQSTRQARNLMTEAERKEYAAPGTSHTACSCSHMCEFVTTDGLVRNSQLHRSC